MHGATFAPVPGPPPVSIESKTLIRRPSMLTFTCGTAGSVADEGVDGPFVRELRRAGRTLPVLPLLVLVLWALGSLVEATRIARWDLRAERFLAAHRTPWADSVTHWATLPAEALTVGVVTAVAVAVLRVRTRNWRAPLFVALSVGGEKLVYLAASLLVDRERPPIPTLGTVYATSSFPSGHVGSAVCLYGSLAIIAGYGGSTRRSWLLTVVTAVVVLAVAGSRLYTGFHFPSDVVAGAVAGSTWLTVTYRAVRPIRSQVE